MDITTEKPLRKYEAVIILHPDVSETEQKNFFKRNQETIAKYSGRVNHLDTWGKRRLANMINKLRLGTYFHTTFEAKGECVAELERVMKIDDRVLRYLHVRIDDRKPLSQFVDEYHALLAESLKREQEKEAKFQARKMGGGDRGERGDRGDRGDRQRGPREVSYGGKRGAMGEDDDGMGEDI